MSPRRRRSGIKSLVGSWRGQQMARESLQDRLASLPYEVLEQFLRERGYEPANRGHAVILMVRHFQTEAEEMVARYGSGGSSLKKVDTVSDTAEATAADTLVSGVSDSVSGLAGRVSPTGAATADDAAEDAATDTATDTTIETTEYTVAETPLDTTTDTGVDTGSRSLQEGAEPENSDRGAALDTAADTAANTVADTGGDTVATTVADTAAATVVNTGSDTARDTPSDTVAETVADTVSKPVAPTVEATVADTVSDASVDTHKDTETDTPKDTADTAAETPADTVPDTVEEPVAAATEPKALAVAGGGGEPAGEHRPSPASQVGGPMRIRFPAWEEPLELPAASEVRWVPASQWRGPSRAAGEFLKNRARWWVERRSAADAGATQLVGVYLLPEHRATLERLRSESGMEAYKLIGLALELLLHEVAAGQELPELPPRDRRTSRVLYLFGLQTRPRLDQEGKRLFVRLHPPLWHCVEQISRASYRSPSEVCNIAVYVLAETLSRLAP